MIKYIRNYKIRKGGGSVANKNVRVYEMSSSDAKKYIRKLTVENRRLNREIDELKREIDGLHGKVEKRRKRGKYQLALDRRSDYENMFSKRNYFSFIFTNLKHTSIFNIYKRFIFAIRRYALLTTTIKIASVLLLLVETAALFVLSTSAFFVSVFLTVLTSHVLALLTVFVRKKSNKQNAEIIRDKNVTVLFPPKERAFEIGSYFSGFAEEEAKKQNSVVIIVSPYNFKAIGLSGSRKGYYVSRYDGENILLVRRYYYFTLRNKIIDKYASHITEIY